MTLCGLKQAPRAWYGKPSSFLISNDDIIFCATNKNLFKNFSNLMQSEFRMSMMGELKFFLRLQVKQEDKGI
ncbi:hypothetical protein CR513_15580, partial [Mucuna pruriens]